MTMPALDRRPELNLTTRCALAYAQGSRQGFRLGQPKVIRAVLEAKFGQLSPTAEQRLDNIDCAQIKQLGIKLLTAQSLEELGLAD